MAGRIFAAAYHFTDVDDDFGEGDAATLVRSDPRSYRQAQRSYECEETQPIARDESAAEWWNTSR